MIRLSAWLCGCYVFSMMLQPVGAPLGPQAPGVVMSPIFLESLRQQVDEGIETICRHLDDANAAESASRLRK